MKRAVAVLLVAILAWPALDGPGEARGRRGGGYHRGKGHSWTTHRARKPRRKSPWRRASRWAAVGVGAASLVALGTAGAAALASGTTLWALADGLNVRSRPSRRASVVDTLARGEAVTATDAQGAWVEVETAEGRTGWVHADYLTEADPDDDA
ncbi:MAG: SH3 domain-containing protein [Candidatus Sericytochromatia bacterium]|nr:SH3 domain-containing protein [Candidatus Sericytochromatia bacterium]